jgi:hypothetical protein
VTQLGIKPMTLWLVAQSLNQLHYHKYVSDNAMQCSLHVCLVIEEPPGTHLVLSVSYRAACSADADIPYISTDREWTVQNLASCTAFSTHAVFFRFAMGCACPSRGVSAVRYLPVQNALARPLLTLFTHAAPQTVDTCPQISTGWHPSTPETLWQPFGPVWMDSSSSLTCTVMSSVLALHLAECYLSTQASPGMTTKLNAYLYHCHFHSSTVNGFSCTCLIILFFMTVRKTRILIFNIMRICTFALRI